MVGLRAPPPPKTTRITTSASPASISGVSLIEQQWLFRREIEREREGAMQGGIVPSRL
jgi:hypothetical protein